MPVKSEIQCPRCGHVETVEGSTILTLADIGLFVCTRTPGTDDGGCGCRVVHGKVEPRVVVEPYVDEHGVSWLRRRIQDGVTARDLFVFDLDGQHAAREAVNILSVTVGT